MVVVALEGNIGCGKSTVLRQLAVKMDADVRVEPVRAWRQHWLPAFYADRARWALAFQAQVLLDFGQKPSGRDVVFERSPTSCQHVFGELLRQNGAMCAAEWAVFEQLCQRCGWAPDLTVYLNTRPDTCWCRMRERGRDEELGGITHSYLTQLDSQYAKMLATGVGGKVVVIDADGLCADAVTTAVTSVLYAHGVKGKAGLLPTACDASTGDASAAHGAPEV